MTGYKSKRAAAQDKLKCQCSLSTKLVGSGCQYCNPEYMDDHSEDILNMAAQPAQEPVAWMNPSWIDPDTRGWQSDSFESIPIEGWLPLYTAPPQRPWVGLTRDEVLGIEEITKHPLDFYRAIEAALKERNA
jgi:hypothetical protein